MTGLHSLRLLGLSLLLAGAAATAGQAIDVPALQRLLQQAPKRDLRFHETRESRWLPAPVESTGTLTSSATMLEKVVDTPRSERWQILDDRMQVSTPGSAAQQVMFVDAPGMAVLAGALRRIVAGDLRALEGDFRLEPIGDQRQWTLQLSPRQPEAARVLQYLELRGNEVQLQLIVIQERQGDRSTIRLIHDR
jgi:hypothetical protein